VAARPLEPKVTNGYGYTVAAKKGHPARNRLGVTDVVNAT